MRGPRRPSGRRGPVIVDLSCGSIDQPALRTRCARRVFRVPRGDGDLDRVRGGRAVAAGQDVAEDCHLDGIGVGVQSSPRLPTGRWCSHGALRSGTTSGRPVGTDGRAASGVASRATMVTGCWQWGQLRVAVGSRGSRSGVCREVARVAGLGAGGSSGSDGSGGGAERGASPRRRARSSSRAWSRRCSASLRQVGEQ